MSRTVSSMTGTRGEQVALKDVAVTATLRGVLAEVALAQTYHNTEAVNIEAVYTFALPVDAVLLELDVILGERVLKGTVVPAAKAERDYETAVAKGDSAVLLQVAEPGLYTMNLGNLMAGEIAKITVRYAQCHQWSGNRLRLHIPTTVAPRYGDSVLPPHQQPEHSMTVENQFSVRVEVTGSLREARITCPSHAVAAVQHNDVTLITLDATRAVMDRDFVLELLMPSAAQGVVLSGRDGDRIALLASFQPHFPGLVQARPLRLVIAVDCSGSMAGVSIEQARRALDSIVSNLQPHDAIGLLAFGSDVRVLDPGLVACTPANIKRAQAFVRELDANLGGTEIGVALARAHAMPGTQEADILLITDGEVDNWSGIVDASAAARGRVFCVGVGSAVAEAFLRQLSARTGGACELVSPNEGMADRVVRHFERMRAARARSVNIRWPAGAEVVGRSTEKEQPIVVFDGDTLFSYAHLSAPAGPAGAPRSLGEVVLEVVTESGAKLAQSLTIPAPGLATGRSTGGSPPPDETTSTIARLAAAARLRVFGTRPLSLGEEQASELAVRYRLLTAWTHWIVVADRAADELATELPALRKVPQTLAAGWGGTGLVAAPRASMKVSRTMSMSTMAAERVVMQDISASYEHFDRPMFSRPRETGRATRRAGSSLDALIDHIVDMGSEFDGQDLRLLLGATGWLDDLASLLDEAEAAGIDPREAGLLVLQALLRASPGWFPALKKRKALNLVQKALSAAGNSGHNNVPITPPAAAFLNELPARLTDVLRDQAKSDARGIAPHA